MRSSKLISPSGRRHFLMYLAPAREISSCAPVLLRQDTIFFLPSMLRPSLVLGGALSIIYRTEGMSPANKLPLLAPNVKGALRASIMSDVSIISGPSPLVAADEEGGPATNHPSPTECTQIRLQYVDWAHSSCQALFETPEWGSPEFCSNQCLVNILRGEAEMAIAGCPSDIFDCGKHGNTCGGDQQCGADFKCHDACSMSEDPLLACGGGGVCFNDWCWDSVEEAERAEPQAPWMQGPLGYALICANNGVDTCTEALFSADFSWDAPAELCPVFEAAGCCATTYTKTMGVYMEGFMLDFFTYGCPNVDWEQPTCDIPTEGYNMAGLEFCYRCGGDEAISSPECAALAAGLDQASPIVANVCDAGDIPCLFQNICGGSWGGGFQADDMQGVCVNCDFGGGDAVFKSCWEHAQVACVPGASEMVPDYCATCENVAPGDNKVECKAALKTQRDKWCNDEDQITDQRVCAETAMASILPSEQWCMDEEDIFDAGWCSHECAPVFVKMWTSLAFAGCAIDVFHCDRPDGLGAPCDDQADEVCAAESDHECHQVCVKDKDCNGTGEICKDDGMCWTPLQYTLRNENPTGWLELPVTLASLCAVNEEEEEACMDLVMQLDDIDWGTGEGATTGCALLKDELGCCVGTMRDTLKYVSGERLDMLKLKCPSVDWDTPACAADSPTFADIPGLEFCRQCGGSAQQRWTTPNEDCVFAAKALFSGTGDSCAPGRDCGVCNRKTSYECKEAIDKWAPMCGDPPASDSSSSDDGVESVCVTMSYLNVPAAGLRDTSTCFAVTPLGSWEESRKWCEALGDGGWTLACPSNQIEHLSSLIAKRTKQLSPGYKGEAWFGYQGGAQPGSFLCSADGSSLVEHYDQWHRKFGSPDEWETFPPQEESCLSGTSMGLIPTDCGIELPGICRKATTWKEVRGVVAPRTAAAAVDQLQMMNNAGGGGAPTDADLQREEEATFLARYEDGDSPMPTWWRGTNEKRGNEEEGKNGGLFDNSSSLITASVVGGVAILTLAAFATVRIRRRNSSTSRLLEG